MSEKLKFFEKSDVCVVLRCRLVGEFDFFDDLRFRLAGAACVLATLPEPMPSAEAIGRSLWSNAWISVMQSDAMSFGC